MCMGFIYKITNLVNNKIYIGQTSLTIRKRWETHIKKAKAHTNRYLYDAMNHYGYNNFIIEQLEECAKEDLDNREKYWISFYNSMDPNVGYNLTAGGGGGNTWALNPHKRETLEKSRMTKAKESYIPITRESLLDDIENKLTIEAMCEKYHCNRQTIKAYSTLFFGEIISKLRVVENSGRFKKKEVDKDQLYSDIIENKLNVISLAKKYNMTANTLNNRCIELFGGTVMSLRQRKYIIFKTIQDEERLKEEILSGKKLDEIAHIFNMSENTLVARLKEMYNMNFKEYRNYVKSKN